MSVFICEGFTIDDLKSIIREAVTPLLQDSKESKKIVTEYITRKETASLLRISLPTLHDFTKTGKLTSHKIGGRVLYRRDEVEAALIQVKPLKYRRG